MTKLIFFHDHKFRKINDNIYSTGGLSQKVLDRYLKVFDEIIIIARIVKESNAGSTYSKIDRNKVTVIDGSKLSLKEMRSIILEATHLILRLPSLLGFKAAFLLRNTNKPYLVEAVACTWDSLIHHSFKGKLLAGPSFIIMRKIVKKAKFVIYVTNNFLQRRYPTEGKSVGISDVVLQPTDEMILESRLKKIDSLYGTITLGTLGAIDVKYKGQKHVIQALGLLKENGITNFKYEIVGSGNKENLIYYIDKYNVNDQVEIIGNIPHSKVFDWLDTIDVYIQPSKVEGLPRALIEAMSRACPAIGSNVGGIPELIEKEYIYNRNIIPKLTNLKKDEMKIEARNNFLKSKKYQEEQLENNRTRFLIEFRDRN